MTKFISELGNDDEVSDELYLARLRNWRNKELKNSDWTQVDDSPVDKNLWAIYRQKLRDLPSQQENPRNIELPIKPK
jgi:hypothetical protein